MEESARVTKDKYDEAIEYLVAHPEDIFDAWYRPSKNPGGCLFLFCTPTGRQKGGYEYCGCPTMVRSGGESADRTLTVLMRLDERIPECMTKIVVTVEGLTPFAEWQRKMDAIWPGRAAQ